MNSISLKYRDILKVAMPISFGAFVQFIVVLTDNIFLAQVSESAFNAVGNGGLMYITGVMIGTGLSAGAQILIARRNGENDKSGVADLFSNTFALLFALGFLLFGVLFMVAEYALPYLMDNQEIVGKSSEFLKIRIFGYLAYFITLAFNSFYLGIAKTKILYVTTFLTAGCNVLFDWVLVLGNLGFPKMEHEGAAYATLAAEIIAATFIIIYSLTAGYGKRFGLFKRLVEFPMHRTKEILRLSLPIMFQGVTALATWTIFFFFIEKLGSRELKISHIARSIYILSFVSIMGFGQTTRTYISTLIAEKRQSELGGLMKQMIKMNFIGVLILCHPIILYPNWVASLFFQDLDEYTLNALILTFRVIFVGMLIFSVGSILINTVQGAGRTLHAMLMELTATIMYIIPAYYLCIIHPSPIYIVWMTDLIYFTAMGTMAYIYLKKSNWKYHKI